MGGNFFGLCIMLGIFLTETIACECNVALDIESSANIVYGYSHDPNMGWILDFVFNDRYVGSYQLYAP